MPPSIAFKEINAEELTTLIHRVEYAINNDLSLGVEDMKLLLMAITTLCNIKEQLEEKDTTLYKLRKLLGMVQQSEKRKLPNKGSDANDREKIDTRSKKNKAKLQKAKKAPVAVTYHALEAYCSGMACPDCQRGKLYKHEPGRLLRVTGHAPYSAIQHITERLRCNACQEVKTAILPAEVLSDGEIGQQYGYSARAMMVIHKFYSGIPYYHQGNLADIFGYAISASTIFDQCEAVADAVIAIVYELKRQAANAPRFLLDDTHNRILHQQPEYREKRHGKGLQLRTGIYSSGIIALTEDEHEIVLFETSLGHAGEFLDSLLKQRIAGLPIPQTMSDALNNNKPTVIEAKRALCNAHCRRQFVEIKEKAPEKVEWLLDTYGIIWEIDREVKEKRLNHAERLAYHKEHSLPAMEKLRDWALEQQQSDRFEEHSGMGKAVRYLLNHYRGLSLFCAEEGALIDNNRMEETLKIIIRGRKTSHFFSTKTGADIGNVLTSLLATAYRAEINIFEYLLALQKNKASVKANPAAWVPWAYQEQLL